jgi:hypothetical protein
LPLERAHGWSKYVQRNGRAVAEVSPYDLEATQIGNGWDGLRKGIRHDLIFETPFVP